MTSILHRPATFPDGREVAPLHVRKNDPEGKTATIGFWDDDQGFVIVAQEVVGEYAPLLAASSSLYYMVCEMADHVHESEGHAENAGYPKEFRDCPMTACERAARTLLGADRQGPLI
jgi:hypothetical protein